MLESFLHVSDEIAKLRSHDSESTGTFHCRIYVDTIMIVALHMSTTHCIHG